MGSLNVYAVVQHSSAMKRVWRGISSAISLSMIMSVSFPAGVLLAPAGHVFAAVPGSAPILATATVNGAASTTVSVNSSIAVAVGGAPHDNSAASAWSSVGWRISTTAPGSLTCVNITDIGNPNGISTTTFNVTAPGTVGTFNAYFQGFTNDTCTNNPSNIITLTGGVVTKPADVTPPTVSSINRTGVTPAAASSVSWTVTFSESVTGVDSADFSLVNSGLTAPSVTGVVGSGTTYTVTANTGTGSGTLGLNLVDNDSIIDGSANKLGGTGAGNGNFTGQVYTIDRTAPQVTTSHIQSSNATTNLAKVGDTVTVTFTANEAVRTPALSIAGHSVAVATTSGNSFTGSYVMQSTDSTGNVGVNLSLTDLAGNAMVTPATVTTDSSTVTFDKTAPTITSITSTQANGSYPASTVIPVSVSFSEVVTVTGTPTLVLNDGGTATYQSGSGTNALVYSHTVSSGENTSDLTVSSAAGSVADVTGNVANMTLPVGANLGNNSDIVIDTTAPTVSLSTGVSTPTNSSPFTTTVTFSEPVIGFDLTDVTVGGVDGTTLGNLQTSDNTTFTFEVTPGAEGHVLLTVRAAAASDAASNLNSAQSNTLDITYDTTVPALEITSGPSDPINTDEDVASFAFTTDGTVISCSIDGTATTSSCASPFTVGGSSGALTEGTHVFYVESKDDAGNTALATRSFTVDLTAPTIDAMSDISVTATSPSGAAITYTVPTGHDNIDDAVVVTCDVATSTTLAIGDHVVTCSTHDKAGNTPKSRIFHIYVNDLDGGQFTGIDATQPSATADGTYANGWHWTLKFKLPFGETKFKMKWSDFSSGSDTVTADNIRFCSEQSDMDCSDDSHYMTITASSTMSSAIILSDDADNTADGRQVEIRVEVKVPPTTVPGSYSASYQATSDTVAPPIES